jgi:hypothetical protein
MAMVESIGAGGSTAWLADSGISVLVLVSSLVAVAIGFPPFQVLVLGRAGRDAA